LIRQQGITPDIVVKIPPGGELLSPLELHEMTAEELLVSKDPQLLKALEILDAMPPSKAGTLFPTESELTRWTPWVKANQTN